MTFYYFDSSAWLKNYFNETGSQCVAEIFAQDCHLASSYLGLAEVIGTLARARKGRVVSDAEYEEMLSDVKSDWNTFVQGTVDDAIGKAASEAGEKWALKGADAVHFATASLLSSQLSSTDQMFLVTADTELVSAAIQTGMQVIDPNQI